MGRPQVVGAAIVAAEMEPSCSCPCATGTPLSTVIRLDVDRYRYLAERDVRGEHEPGRRSSLLVALRVLLFYPGLYGVLAYRVAHAFRTSRLLPGPARLVLSGLAVLVQRALIVLTGVEMSAQAHVGPGLFINHSRGVVIGAIDAGENLTVSHGVTLGQATGTGPAGRRCPQLGDRVWLGPGAVVVGAIRVGGDAVVGANAVVLADVPARGVALGVPAQVLSSKGSFGTVLYRGMDADRHRADSLRAVANA